MVVHNQLDIINAHPIRSGRKKICFITCPEAPIPMVAIASHLSAVWAIAAPGQGHKNLRCCERRWSYIYFLRGFRWFVKNYLQLKRMFAITVPIDPNFFSRAARGPIPAMHENEILKQLQSEIAGWCGAKLRIADNTQRSAKRGGYAHSDLCLYGLRVLRCCLRHAPRRFRVMVLLWPRPRCCAWWLIRACTGGECCTVMLGGCGHAGAAMWGRWHLREAV